MAEITNEFKNFEKLNEEFINKNIKSFHIFNCNPYLEAKNIILVTNDDKVYCTGCNCFGLLGLSQYDCHGELAINEDLSDKQIIQFHNGRHHTIARTIDGKILCFGLNKDGVLGNGFDDYNISNPQLNNHLQNENIIDVSCGGFHTLVLTTNGEVYAWGHNVLGQIGNSHEDNCVSEPFKVKDFNGEKVKAISCGFYHSIALTENGRVYSWGCNSCGQLGIGNKRNCNSPKSIKLDETIIIDEINCGSFHSLLLSREKDIYIFGLNFNIKLESIVSFVQLERLFQQLTPIKLNSSIKFTKIASHFDYKISCALSENGSFYFWGEIDEGLMINEPVEIECKSFQEIFTYVFERTPTTSLLKNGKYKKLYSNESKIGSGSYGTVFKVKYIRNGEVFAIKKVLRKITGIALLDKEADFAFGVIFKLENENLIKYNDMWVECDHKMTKNLKYESSKYKDILYIRMELCDNTLSEYLEDIKNNSKFYFDNFFTMIGFNKLCHMFSDILKGVEFLHNNNIIHRDLKPDNILIKNDRIKIADFGLAKLHDLNRDSNIKYTGNIGDMKYISPEVADGENYDTKADIYSLGVILEEIFEIEDGDYIQYINDEILKIKYENIGQLIERMKREDQKERPNCEDILKYSEIWAGNEIEFNPGDKSTDSF